MIDAALLAAEAAGLTAAGLGAIEIIEWRRTKWQSVMLRFGRDVSSEAVVAWLERVAGLHRGVTVLLDVCADSDGISHYLHADQATLDTLRGSVRAVLPSLRLEPVAPVEDVSLYAFGRRVRLRGAPGVIRADNIETVSAGLLAAVQPLASDERLLVRWLIRPGRAVTVPPIRAAQHAEPEARRRLVMKNEAGVVRARGVLAVEAGHPQRAAHLLSRVAAVLRTRSTPYGQLRALPLSGAGLRRALRRRGLICGDRYGVAELAGLLGWPVEAPALPGLALGTSPLLLPSARLPRSGRVLGTATWPGAERPIAQPVIGALSHTLIAGPTGVGKSTLLTNLLASDIAAGRGVVLIDGSKGDTAATVLDRIPPARRDDVIVLDCASAGAQPGLRLFGDGDPQLAADLVLGVLGDLFRDSWGPLSERYLRAGLVAVAHDPDGTLADVPFVFTDAGYRRELVGRVRDPLTRATFTSFEAMSAGERQHQLAAPFNKLGTLLGRPVVRTVLGQAKPRLDFRAALRAPQIVVVSLAPARVGAPAARLIGAVTIFALFQAVQARAAVSERARRPAFVYVDEPKALGDLPMPLDALFEQARGLGVGMTLAPQSMAQLPKRVREAALTNAASRVVFRQEAADAGLLARDLPGITAEALGDLAAFEAIARIGLGPGDVAPLVSIRTAPLGPVISDGPALKLAAAERYGLSLDAVDAALQARHRLTASEAPVGRRRRS